MTPAIVAINALVFVLMAVSGVGILTPTVADLLTWGANFGPSTCDGESWRLLSSTFVHVGLLHIGFNMWVLSDLGSLVERLFGRAGFAILYLGSGLLASLASLAWNPLTVSAGASGAVFGVLGGLFAFLLRDRGGVPSAELARLRRSAGVFLLFNLAYGTLKDNVDMAAHLGGLGAGFLGGLLLARNPHADAGQRARRARQLAASTVGVLVVFGYLVVWRGGAVFRVLGDAGRTETSCLDTYNAGLERARSGAADFPQLADLIEEQVLPPWRAAREGLEQVARVPAALESEVERTRRYLSTREEAWSLWATCFRNQGDAALRRRAEAQERAVEAILSEFETSDS